MKRRSFLALVGFGTAAAVTATKAETKTEFPKGLLEPEPLQPTVGYTTHVNKGVLTPREARALVDEWECSRSVMGVRTSTPSAPTNGDPLPG